MSVSNKQSSISAERERTSSPSQRDPRLRFMHAYPLAAQPPHQDWLVDGILPADALIGVIGAPSSFKSAIVTDMAVCISAGVPWHKFKVKPGSALILAGEGNSGYGRRLKAIAKDRKIKLKRTKLYISNNGLGLLNATDIALFKKKIERFQEKHHEYPSLIVVDTVARNFGAGDENSAVDMGKFIEHMDSIRRKYRCAVILIHHTGHANPSRARGSSSFKAALDCEITFIRKAGDHVVVSCSKNKDTEKFDPLTFKLKTVPVSWKTPEGIETFKSFVMKHTPPPAINPARKQQAALKLLNKMESTDALAKTTGIRSGKWKSHLLRNGIVSSEKAYEHLRQRMLSAKKITQPTRGYVRSLKS